MIYNYLPLEAYDIELKHIPASANNINAPRFLFVRRTSHPFLLTCRRTSADLQDVLRPLFSGHLIIDSTASLNWLSAFQQRPSWRWLLAQVTHITIDPLPRFALPTGTPGTVFPNLVDITFRCTMEDLVNQRTVPTRFWRRFDRGPLLLTVLMVNVGKGRDTALKQIAQALVGTRPCGLSLILELQYWGWEAWRTRCVMFDLQQARRLPAPSGWVAIDRSGPVQTTEIKGIIGRALHYRVELWANRIVSFLPTW